MQCQQQHLSTILRHCRPTTSIPSLLRNKLFFYNWHLLSKELRINLIVWFLLLFVRLCNCTGLFFRIFDCVLDQLIQRTDVLTRKCTVRCACTHLLWSWRRGSKVGFTSDVLYPFSFYGLGERAHDWDWRLVLLILKDDSVACCSLLLVGHMRELKQSSR